jgi:predicted glycoside hydrolase/deacetylase ChbG (UPF0249 family)
MPPRQSKLILTADDYGACDFIDNGIIKAIKAGKINSVACFVVPFGKEDEFDARMDMLIDLQNDYDFGIGLHFSLTAGRPLVNKLNSLCTRDKNDGLLYFRAAYNYSFKNTVTTDLRAELRAQIKKLADKLGGVSKIDSVSMHDGIVYLDNGLFQQYANVLAEQKVYRVRSPRIWRRAGLPCRNWLMNPLIRQGIWLRQLNKLRDSLDHQSRLKMLDALGLRYPTCLVDEIYGQPDAFILDELLYCFNKEVFSAEFMFHLGDPAYREAQDLSRAQAHEMEFPWGIDPDYFAGRELEFEMLMDEELGGHPAIRSKFKDLVKADAALPERIGS